MRYFGRAEGEVMLLLEHTLLAIAICLTILAVLLHPRAKLDEHEDEHATHAGSEAGSPHDKNL